MLNKVPKLNIANMNMKSSKIKATSVAIVYVNFVTAVSGVLDQGGAGTAYEPEDLLLKIFNQNYNILARQRGTGHIKFEDNNNIFDKQNEINLNRITFDYINHRDIKFEDDGSDSQNFVDFDSQNYIQNNSTKNQNIHKKRKKRRKPKQYGLERYPGSYGLYNGYQGANYYNPRPVQQYYRPAQYPRPSSDTLSSIVRALTSIAQYDDLQCVPRLLCEAASGGVGSESSGGLQNLAGLNPLLTLLSAYNGVTSSPLFVFGRAVLLGMSSKNVQTCRTSYTACPADPEKLIYYLNNHNGGFFRFFSNPQINQENLQQFYNQLSVNGYQNPYFQHYGFQEPNIPYGGGYGYYNNVYKGLHPQRRIQNKPNNNEQYGNPQFSSALINGDSNNGNSRDGNTFKFPDQINIFEGDYINDKDYKRKSRGFIFPEQNNYYNEYQYTTPLPNYNLNNRFQQNKNINNVDDTRLIYVVRGNGDPNHPEIVRLKPGEKLN